MEEEIMKRIYNYVFDTKHEWNIKNVEKFTNIENQEVVRFTNNEGKSFIIRIEEEF